MKLPAELIESISPHKVKNILIVKQHNQFGDMICTLPLFAAVRKKYPGAFITLVVSPGNYEILDGENPYIDKFIVYDKSSLSGIFRFYLELRKVKYELGIVPSTFAISRTSHLINRFSKARVRVGVKSIPGIQNKYHKLLNIKKDFSWKDEGKHQSEKFLDIVRQIGCELTNEEKKIVKISYSNEEFNTAKKYFKKNFSDPSRPVISFQPGAGKIENRWSLGNFEKLIELLYNEFNIYVFMIYGPQDKELVENLNSRLMQKEIPCTVISLPIRETSILLSMTDLYITNDTGTMHSAAYSGANVISLFGPTKGFDWAPEKDNCIYLQSPGNDINGIPVEEVYRAAKKYLTKLRKE